MEIEAFRVIPGFEKWCITRDGRIFHVETGNRIRTYMYGDRMFANYPENTTDRLVSVHRAVALAWVENDDPHLKTVVNHLDGNPLNNWYKNLEWTTTSGNNYHAVNTGLRTDNMPCKIRDFHTKEIREFPSISQACDFMKLPNNTTLERLRPRKFGALIAGRYEFRLKDDHEPFFYENRDFIISPSRYMVEVTHEDGSKRYLFKNGELMLQYQLYKSPYGRSVPGLLKYAEELHPNKKFKLRDGFSESTRTGSRSRARSTFQWHPVIARNGDKTLEFKSITAAAGYFNVDRDVIRLRLSNSESRFLGWSFEGKPVSIPLKTKYSNTLETFTENKL